MNYIQQGFLGNNEWWRHLITNLILLGPFALNILVIVMIPEIVEESYNQLQNEEINKNFFLFSNLILFIFLFAALLLFVKFLHNRSIRSLITARKKVDWKRFFLGFLFWGILNIALLYIGYLMDPEMYVWNYDPVKFFTLLAIVVIMIPIQTSYEELYFRGYLMQSVGTLVKNKWVPFIFTSVFFGLMHSFNPEVDKLGNTIMIYYIGTGLLFGMITLLDEGTELVLGMHAVNNIIAATLITNDWAVFQTDALVIDKTEPEADLMMFLPMLIIYPLVIIVFSKMYKWKNWKDKLFGKVENPIAQNPIDELGS
jgi:membrane protease YdiL (CAAX protease family)